MLITKHFTFLHIPKTGGSFIVDVCHRDLPAEWLVPNELHPHSRYDQVPPELRDRPVFCYVRNPWDWYVSWYHYMIKHPPREPHSRTRTPLWYCAFDSGRSDFREATTRALTGRGFDNRGHLRTVPLMRQLDVDHYTALHLLMTGDGLSDGTIEVGRFERLSDDFLAFLERHDVPVSATFVEAIRTGAPLRASERGPYRDYYDEELRDLVAARAHRLVGAYGYEF
jgi:hypothetical protein